MEAARSFTYPSLAINSRTNSFTGFTVTKRLQQCGLPECRVWQVSSGESGCGASTHRLVTAILQLFRDHHCLSREWQGLCTGTSAVPVLSSAYNFKCGFISSFHKEIYLRLEYALLVVTSSSTLLTSSPERSCSAGWGIYFVSRVMMEYFCCLKHAARIHCCFQFKSTAKIPLILVEASSDPW